jgi:site-specific DNA-methyltransferase (adenine-specific)
MSGLATNRILVGDARQVLRNLPSSSIDCVVTSPPYFRLRNYQHDDQIGLERHVDQWVESLLTVMREVARLLKPAGSLWLNLGDTYARSAADGAIAKSLVLAPERVARAMAAEGWTIRNKVIWAKPNPMPTSVRDRLACTYEVVYFATRSIHYFFDLDAIRVPHTTARAVLRTSFGGERRRSTTQHQARPAWAVPREWRGPLSGQNHGLDRLKASGERGHPFGKNPGDVWTIPTASYPGAHHAVYPERLIERPILATCPERICTSCGTPWERQRYRRIGHVAVASALAQRCDCAVSETMPGVVLDPFIGSGTTAIAAERLGRRWIGVEVNHTFAAAATDRIEMARDGRERPPALGTAA